MAERESQRRKGSSRVEGLLGRESPSLRAAPWLRGRLDPSKLGEQVRELTAWLLREHFLGAPLTDALSADLHEEVDAIVRRFESSALVRGVLNRDVSLKRIGEVLDAFVWLAALDLVRWLRTKFDEIDRQREDKRFKDPFWSPITRFLSNRRAGGLYGAILPVNSKVTAIRG